MIWFDRIEDAIEEAAFCAKEDRTRYYVFPSGDRFMVRKKHGGEPKPKRQHIEVGFKQYKRGRKPDI